MKNLCLIVAAALSAVTTPVFAGELRINVQGLRSPKGTIFLGLYDSKESFDRAIALSDNDGFVNDPQRVAGAALRVDGRPGAAIVFEDLDPGRYAVILLHDEDGNGRLDKNFWGVPTEPYAFSNDAQGFLGPPGFGEAAFEFDGGNKTLAITLVHHAHGVASLRPSYLEEEDNGTKPGGSASIAGQ